jgi:hypothetical protein
MTDAKLEEIFNSDYEVVLISGLAGWGERSLVSDVINYWNPDTGSSKYTPIVVDAHPFIHPKYNAIDIFFQLVGGTAEISQTEANEMGLLSNKTSTYSGLLNNPWSKDNKIWIITHSLGVWPALFLQALLASNYFVENTTYGDRTCVVDTNADWIAGMIFIQPATGPTLDGLPYQVAIPGLQAIVFPFLNWLKEAESTTQWSRYDTFNSIYRIYGFWSDANKHMIVNFGFNYHNDIIENDVRLFPNTVYVSIVTDILDSTDTTFSFLNIMLRLLNRTFAPTIEKSDGILAWKESTNFNSEFSSVPNSVRESVKKRFPIVVENDSFVPFVKLEWHKPGTLRTWLFDFQSTNHFANTTPSDLLKDNLANLIFEFARGRYLYGCNQ